MKKIKITPELIGILGVLLTCIGTIVPTIYIANMPLNYIEGDGKFIALAMIIVLTFMMKKKAIFSLIPTTLSCGILIRYLWMTAPTKAIEMNLIRIASYGPGLYLMIIGLSLCLIYGTWGNQEKVKKERIAFNKRYFVISLIFPIIGIYYFIHYYGIYKEKAMNGLRGASLGLVMFLGITISYILTI